MTKLSIDQVAQLCHEVNRKYCQTIGDHSQRPWSHAADWQRESAILGVRKRLEDVLAHPSVSHEHWMTHKLADGWTYGPEKDEQKKQHPCMVPYSELSPEQRAKDYFFCTTVIILRALGLIDGYEEDPSIL